MKRMIPPVGIYARRVPALYFSPSVFRDVFGWSSRTAVVLLAALAGACSGSPTEPTLPPTPLTLSLASEAWTTLSDPQPFPLANNESRDLVFDFPAVGSMNYLFTPSTLAAIRGTLVVSLSITASGSPIFNSLDAIAGGCTIPASVRPFLWANENGNDAYDRWWSNPRSHSLAGGTATISVPLQAEFWSSVNGRIGSADTSTRYSFDKALLNVTRLGLTFGGGCSFGHGINVRGGSAQFQLTRYAIQ